MSLCSECHPLILCPYCEVYWPVSHFGIVRARPSGRNLYCKDCARIKTELTRARKKVMKLEQAEALKNPDRKPVVCSPRIVRSATDKVRQAIDQGARTRVEIQRVTGLTMDQVVDALAILTFEKNALRSRVVSGERVWVAA